MSFSIISPSKVSPPSFLVGIPLLLKNKLINNFLVKGIKSKKPIESVKKPGIISNNAAKAKEIKEKHNYNMTASQYLDFQRSVAEVIEYAPEG